MINDDEEALTEQEEKQLYDLWSHTSIEQQQHFLKAQGLIYLHVISPTHILDKIEQQLNDKEFDNYIDAVEKGNYNNEYMQDLIERADALIQSNSELYLLCPLSELETGHRMFNVMNVYKCVDGNENDVLLLANCQAPQKYIDEYKSALHKGYSASQLWNLDNSIALSVLPIALEELREKCHGYPPSCESSDEWDKILAEIIWYLCEVIENKDVGDVSNDCQSDKSIQYIKRRDNAKRLFGDYFEWLID